MRFFDPSSPWQYLILSALAAILFLLRQVVTVVPYPNQARDKLLWDLGTGAAALIFFALACWAERRHKRP
jgi:hypothetical protein